MWRDHREYVDQLPDSAEGAKFVVLLLSPNNILEYILSLPHESQHRIQKKSKYKMSMKITKLQPTLCQHWAHPLWPGACPPHTACPSTVFSPITYKALAFELTCRQQQHQNQAWNDQWSWLDDQSSSRSPSAPEEQSLHSFSTQRACPFLSLLSLIRLLWFQ